MPNIRADELELFVEEQFLDDLGPYERQERVYVPASGHGEELERTVSALARIRKEADAGLYDDDEKGYMARVSALVARRKELEQSPSQPAHWKNKSTGETYRQAWNRMNSQDERRELLIEHGIEVRAVKVPGKTLESFYHSPVDIIRKKVPEFRKDA